MQDRDASRSGRTATQSEVPADVLAAALRPLPGMLPLEMSDWLRADDAFAAQMASRDDLIANRTSLVHRVLPEALPAAQECLDMVLAHLAGRNDYAVNAGSVRRPDGVEVAVDRTAPLVTLGRLVQEDICILQDGTGGHRLTAAILCFPSHWTLGEKIGRALPGIHSPVAPYDSEMARRVQRLFDGIRTERPLWRANALFHSDAELFAPRREADARQGTAWDEARFLRSERQCLLRLPRTRAVVFSIHTYIVPLDRMAAAAPDLVAALRARRLAHRGEAR